MTPSTCQNPMTPNPSFLDVHEIHEVTVLVATSSSSPDSSPSISTDSPTLLNSEHDARSSLASTHGSLTVRFAPLPQIDANRKRSLAPVGVSARSRRRRVMQQEGEVLWSTDPDAPENMEDPIITFAKFVKKTGQTLWRRMRKGSKVAPQENATYSAEPILDITGKSITCSDVAATGEKSRRMVEAVPGGEAKRGRPASWSPSSERRTLHLDVKAKRRSTSDLSVP